jgi:hypothetical protein
MSGDIDWWQWLGTMGTIWLIGRWKHADKKRQEELREYFEEKRRKQQQMEQPADQDKDLSE